MPRVFCVALLFITLPITFVLLLVAALEVRTGDYGSLDGLEHRFSKAQVCFRERTNGRVGDELCVWTMHKRI